MLVFRLNRRNEIANTFVIVFLAVYFIVLFVGDSLRWRIKTQTDVLAIVWFPDKMLGLVEFGWTELISSEIYHRPRIAWVESLISAGPSLVGSMQARKVVLLNVYLKHFCLRTDQTANRKNPTTGNITPEVSHCVNGTWCTIKKWQTKDNLNSSCLFAIVRTRSQTDVLGFPQCPHPTWWLTMNSHHMLVLCRLPNPLHTNGASHYGVAIL